MRMRCMRALHARATRVRVWRGGAQTAIREREGELRWSFERERGVTGPGRSCGDTFAGDTFAGAFIGSLNSSKNTSFDAMKIALIQASAMASFCVEDFGVRSIINRDFSEIKGIKVISIRTPQIKNINLLKRAINEILLPFVMIRT